MQELVAPGSGLGYKNTVQCYGVHIEEDTRSKMKLWIFTCLFLLINYLAVTLAECPPGEYPPGPAPCGIEPSCAAPSSHARPKTACDCWCKPGTYRIMDATQACVTLSGCH